MRRLGLGGGGGEEGVGRGVRWVRTSIALSGPRRHSHLPFTGQAGLGI